MKRILINATQEEELRVAIVDGQKLIDLDIETPSAGRKKSNIYKGVIARIEPGLDAVFVDYGDPKHGFLPFREISQAYFKNKTAGGRNNTQAIARSLHQGQHLLVQVQREGHGGKGAALTTFISLAGRYLVLMPNNPRAGGVSRRAGDSDRNSTRQNLSQLNLRDEEGVIIRTKGVGCDPKLLQRDLDYLRGLWDSIISSAKGTTAPVLVYEESNIVICALRDHLSDDTEEIIVDDEKVFNDARDFIKLVMPQQLSKLQLYQESVPLFNRYQIENQIETAFDREITLPSGGSVVFDRTEALLSIDINSGKATRGSNIEETALNTNLEAAEEIARQLRLRDLGGLIVIDFIDMMPLANRKAVEGRLQQVMSQDQARVQLERISRFGLLEMSRQRLRPSLGESSHQVCPRCSGIGFIRTLESSALSTLRMMEEEAMKEKSGRVVAQLPIEITSFLLNEKREKINEIESRHNIQLVIVPDVKMQIPHFQIRRYRADDEENLNKYSYEMVTERKPALTRTHSKSNDTREKPALGSAVDFMNAKNMPSERFKFRFLSRLLTLITDLFRKKTSPTTTADTSEEYSRPSRRRGGRRRGGRSQEQRQSSGRQYNSRPPASNRATDKPSDGPSGRYSDRPSGRYSDRSSDRPSGRYSDRSSDRPSGRPSGRPSDRPAEARSSDRFSDRPAEARSSDRPSDRPAEARSSDRFSDRPAEARSSGRSSDRPAEGRSRNSRRSPRTSSSSDRRPSTPGTSVASRRRPQSDNRRYERQMTPPPHVTDQPSTNDSIGGTVFTPPMPILPDTPPMPTLPDTPSMPTLPDVSPSQTNSNDNKETHAASSPVDKPVLPSTPPIPAAQPPTAAPEMSRADVVATEADTATGKKVESKPATAQPQTVPYSPPRFSKPSNLTQVETKPAPPEQD